TSAKRRLLIPTPLTLSSFVWQELRRLGKKREWHGFVQCSHLKLMLLIGVQEVCTAESFMTEVQTFGEFIREDATTTFSRKAMRTRRKKMSEVTRLERLAEIELDAGAHVSREAGM